MAREVGILFYRNMIEHCKVEFHVITRLAKYLFGGECLWGTF